MSNIVKGLIAAAIMLGVAFGNRAGLVPQDVADTLVIILPLMLVLSMKYGCAGICMPRSGKA